MNYGINILLVMVAFSATLAKSNAQGIKDDLVKINQAYQDSGSFYAEAIYTVSSEKDKTFSPDIQKGSIFKTDNYRYNKIGEIETIIEDSLQLTLDHSQDMMLLTLRKEAFGEAVIQIPEIEKALRKCTRIMPLKTSSGKGYELWLEDESCEKISFAYDPDTYRITQMEFLYRKIYLNGREMQNVKLGMEYSYPEPDLFSKVSLDRYVRQVNDTYLSTASYESYRLIDYTEIIRKTSDN